MLDWFVWDWTVFDFENAFTLNWSVLNIIVWLNWINWNRNISFTIKLCTYGKLIFLK